MRIVHWCTGKRSVSHLALTTYVLRSLVGKAEIDRTPAAKASVQKEWDRLRCKLVWDEQNPRELDDVQSKAKCGGGVHSAYGLYVWHMR